MNPNLYSTAYQKARLDSLTILYGEFHLQQFKVQPVPSLEQARLLDQVRKDLLQADRIIRGEWTGNAEAFLGMANWSLLRLYGAHQTQFS